MSHSLRLRAAGFSVFVGAALVAVFSFSFTAHAATNLIGNPSVEVASSTAKPANWSNETWGTTQATYTYATGVAQDGSRSLKTQVTFAGNGDAEWFFKHTPVSANQTYTYSEYYSATVPTTIVAEFRRADGSYVFVDLATVPASASWAKFEKSFVTPANTVTMTVYHYIKSVGTLSQDNFSLILGTPQDPNNLVPNPTLNITVPAGAGLLPANWNKGAWGAASNAVFTYPTAGVDDNYAAQVSISTYNAVGTGNGAAQWFFEPVPVVGGQFYSFTNSYKSDTNTYLVAQWTLSNGAVMYEPITTLPSSGNVWKTASHYFTAPVTATKLSVFHLLQSRGTLTVDRYALTSYAPPAAERLTTGVVTLTLDDGLTSQYQNALPILKSTNVPATFYIISDFMQAASNDFFGSPTQSITASTTKNGTTWSPIYTDPSVQSYRFEDTYTSGAASTVVVRYSLNGVVTTQTLGTVAAGTNALAEFVFTLPKQANGSTVTPITISHTNGSTLTTSAPSLIRYSTNIGKNQMLNLQKAGQEVSVHTKTHPDLVSLASAAASNEIVGARSVLQALGITPANSLAYPYGSYNAQVEQLAAGAGMVSARTIDIGYNSKTADKLALKSNSVVTATNFVTIKSWIDTAVANKLWLILTIHQVDTAANLAAQGAIYGTTPEILTQVANYLATLRTQGSVQVKTMGQALPLLAQ